MDVSKDAALAACERARAKNRRRYFSADHWQCWGCIRFGGEPDRRCMHTDSDGWDGCTIVNRELEIERSTGASTT